MDNLLEAEQECNAGEDALTNVRRPMNAFFIFCKRHRDIVREKYPHLENRSITKILGEWWANLDASEKASYTALAKQYKEAFMKAHPDFKWYKLPAPPSRRQVTTPSNCRGIQYERTAANCGITLGKLVDDDQLGGLSSLINPSITRTPTTSIDCITIQTSSMAQKGVESILKPPKKRYLINGEFQTHSDMSSVDSRDYQTRDACSALLELAEICASSAAQEGSSIALNLSNRLNDSISFGPSFVNNNKISTLPELTDSVLSKQTVVSNVKNDKETMQNLVLQGPIVGNQENAEETKKMFSFISSNTMPTIHSEDFQQDQPLDLCKNEEKMQMYESKDKTDVHKDSSKTITTSHQQLIDHFVDKFLCDKPVPQNKFYKSEIIDPTFCNLFSEKNPGVTSSSNGGKISHPAFTLSVAIESAVDKAYSKDNSKPYNSKISESNVILDCVTSNNHEYDIHFKVGESKIQSQTSGFKTAAKPSEKKIVKPKSSAFKRKGKQNFLNSASLDCNNHNLTVDPKSKDDIVPENSSKYFCKLVAPPKKSSIWCNLFMKEQLTKNNMESSPRITNSLLSGFSPARRSSQRTCKGRRYQALITEGLLQSPKERKQNSIKKNVSILNKEKNKMNPVTHKHVYPLYKKKKKESTYKSKVPSASYGRSTSLFNLEEKIASLPKCSFDELNNKKKLLESSTHSIKDQDAKTLSSTSVAENSCTSSSEITDSPISSRGRYVTGNFDLEQQIASLPKCNIEMLNKRGKKKD